MKLYVFEADHFFEVVAFCNAVQAQMASDLEIRFQVIEARAIDIETGRISVLIWTDLEVDGLVAMTDERAAPCLWSTIEHFAIPTTWDEAAEQMERQLEGGPGSHHDWRSWLKRLERAGPS